MSDKGTKGTGARPPHPATVAQPKKAVGGVPMRPPHPATVVQPKKAVGGVPMRPPHPATVVQPKQAVGGAPMRPPHPATVAQPKQAVGAGPMKPPHPATVVQPKQAVGGAPMRPPHPATVQAKGAQNQDVPHPASPRSGMTDFATDRAGKRLVQPMLQGIKNFFGGGGPSKDPPKEPPKKPVVVKPVDMVMEEIRALEEMFPTKIVVAYGSLSNDNKADVLRQMRSFIAGTLRVWRGVQQCHPQFPVAPYTTVNAKVPASTDPPDFGDNNNNWIPFYEDQDSCVSVALSWSNSIVGYFNSRGGMDSTRPCALLLERTLSVHNDKVAFGMAPEVQVWGPTTATAVTQYGIDDDWSVLWPTGPHLPGTTFRTLATAAHVTIN